jgi:transcriptional regulator with XRE-family HTH domain
MAKRSRKKWFLREYRLMRGWTQDELAARASIPRSRISELEIGTERYNQDVLEALAKALSLPNSPVSEGDLVSRPPDAPAPIADIWDRIPESQRHQARRVMESFAGEHEATPDPASFPTPKRKKP